MTIKLSDEEREAIDGLRRELDSLKARIDAHLNRQQEPDRFLVMAREVCGGWCDDSNWGGSASKLRAGGCDEKLGSAATYLREQWEADRTELLERVRLALARNGAWVGAIDAVESEFAR